MANSKSKSISESSLKDLATKCPDKVGTYNAKTKELKTPNGTRIPLKLRKFGKSKAAYVTGKVKEFLVGLNLPELAGTEAPETGGNGSGGKGVISLTIVPDHQVLSHRSWGAWFKAHPTANPEAIVKVVTEGHANAKEGIEKALKAKTIAHQKSLDAEGLKAIKQLKEKGLSAERIVELLKGT
jgi:DNA-binding transcriptional regulator YhcF (GntR family)